MSREMVTLTDAVLITCVVQRGLGDTVVKAASGAGAQGATVYFGRGTGVRERLGILGLAVEVEKEIVNVLVAQDQVEGVFRAIFTAAKLDTPGMGIMYTTPVDKMATYIPPDVVNRLVEREED